MDVHKIRPRLAEALNIAQGPLDHEVHVKKHICRLPQGFEHRQADRDVRNEQSVHDVNMQPVRPGCLDFSRFGTQFAKIRR